jgi:hypothetical protein
MRKRQTVKIGFAVLIGACAFLAASPARASLTQRCNWGVTAPTQWPTSTQVMMVPTVMDFGGPPFGTSKVAFVSFRNGSDIANDSHGVLRIIDLQCNEIARFPDANGPQIVPPSCSPYHTNINTFPELSPGSGLAVGNIDGTPDVEIIAVLDDHVNSPGGIIAFRLVSGFLIPQWCSQILPPGDSLPAFSAPAIAQLDKPGTLFATASEIIIDNKVYNSNGTLRYSGFTAGGNNCSTNGGVPCPRSRATVVANLVGPGFLPQVITGRGLYRGTGASWTGSLSWLNSNVTNSSLDYPAVAELDPSPGPEIVVTDTLATRLRVLSATGNQLASIALPNPSLGGATCPNGGGPPIIGNVPAIGTVIGIAGCSRYTVFTYNAGVLNQLWSMPIYDLSGQTTSTLFTTSTGSTRIYYADQYTLWVFDAANGTVLQNLPNSSETAIEGPIVAAFDNGKARGSVIVSANNYWCPFYPPCTAGGQKGIRIFDDPTIGQARSYWNQHSYHATNVTNSVGAIPVGESPSWVAPARNTYRVQQWP